MSSATGVGCTLYVDGAALADSADDYTADPTAPLALAGLQVAWGRTTTVDQPDVGTCTFEVLDRPGGPAFTSLLAVGRRVDVDASGQTFPDPTVSTFVDPGWEAGTVLPAVTAGTGTAARTNVTAHAGAWSLALRPAPERTLTALTPPAPFQVRPNAPDAWDPIPATSPGQAWSVAVALAAAPLVEVVITAVLFSGPYADAAGATLGQVARVWRPDPSVLTTPWTAPPAVRLPVTVAGSWIGLRAAVTDRFTWDAFDPATSWADVDAGWAWSDFGVAYLDDAAVLAPAAGTAQTVRVFSGRVTDVQAGWDDGRRAPVVKVTAADVAADLANRNVGDVPWLVEAMAVRFQRVLTLAGLSSVLAEIPATLGAALLSWQDVDSQGALGLLTDFTQSVDGILWVTTHRVTGPFIRVEDPAARPAFSKLALTGGLIVIVPAPPAGALALSACDVLRDPVTFTQDVADVTTRVEVTWQEQTLDEDGKPAPTDRSVTIVDDTLEPPAGPYGVRRLSLSTLLQAQAAAQTVAAAILARTSVTGWRADGLRITDGQSLTDADAADTTLVLALLSGTDRLGLPLHLTDLPDWAPPAGWGLFLEGGSYTFTGGAWTLDLTCSRATGQGGGGSTWAQLDPAWAWEQWDPTIQWQDLAGVAGPTP